jgi:hypothetical protein
MKQTHALLIILVILLLYAVYRVGGFAMFGGGFAMFGGGELPCCGRNRCLSPDEWSQI